MTARLRSLVPHWREVASLSDEALADRIRRDEIDILVDLSGHTARHRLLTFARKPAPVQVTMIGYMQTTGLSAMDYRITDERLDPPGTSEVFNSEELIRLLSGAAPFRPPADCPPSNELPALRNGFVTFGSFNNLAKVSPEVLATWAELLRAIPTARLLAVGRSGNALQATLETHGIPPDRIEVLPRQSLRDFVALHHRVDVLLDTFPYSGGTTNLIAAWMGVPFVTLAGGGSTERTGAALMEVLGAPELIASDPADYVRRAVEAATDLARLAHWRSVLRDRLAPLLSTGAGFTPELEGAYRTMWRRWCANQPSTPMP